MDEIVVASRAAGSFSRKVSSVELIYWNENPYIRWYTKYNATLEKTAYT
jgi:hypothetical protein